MKFLFNKYLGLRKKELVFVYSEKRKTLGSTVMRGEQLYEIASETLLNYKVKYLPINNKFKNSILFITKGAILDSNVNLFKNLKLNGNTLIFDPVDSILPLDKAEIADLIVASSQTAFENYSILYPDNTHALVDHYIDTRIENLKLKNTSEFKAGYFGELINTIKTSNIEKIVDFISVDTHIQDPKWIHMLPEYNFHYAIRKNRNIDGFKPFLKGFTAAHCNANIIIQDSEPEALLWLGDDYPFLLRGELSEANILATLNRAKKSFEKDDWYKGIDRMREIKLKISKENISQQLLTTLRNLD